LESEALTEDGQKLLAMKSTQSIATLRTWLKRHRGEGHTIGLVPTMGALHEGHLKLVDRARKSADVVVMSIYVNPTQFGPKEDFSCYPRPLQADRRLARERGVDILFHPDILYYPDDSVRVSESAVSLDRCGGSRPGHFDGVATVVTKLFGIVQPDLAVFGQKDGQQVDVIRRLVRDLYLPVRIIAAPIVRDPDGLALSSRNRYLSPEERDKAVQFAAILKDEAVRGGRNAPTRIHKRLQQIPGLNIDYVEYSANRIYVAVRIGKTRLIDNQRIRRPICSQ